MRFWLSALAILLLAVCCTGCTQRQLERGVWAAVGTGIVIMATTTGKHAPPRAALPGAPNCNGRACE